MADFNIAVEKVFDDEGGYSDHANDRGGKTKYGISQASFPSVDIVNLTKEQAKDIYRTHYWKNLSGINYQDLANAVFEICVMSGNKKGVTLLQQAANRCGARLAEDGILGGNTLAAANSINPKWILAELRLLQIENFARIVSRNQSQRAFLLGWINRALT